MEKLIEQTRTLLGWPTTQKLIKLANRFPDEEAWRYAVERLEEAKYPSEPYLISCLETASARLERQRRGGISRMCPYSHGGLVCSTRVHLGKPPEECQGEVECFRINIPPWGEKLKEELSRNPLWRKEMEKGGAKVDAGLKNSITSN